MLGCGRSTWLGVEPLGSRSGSAFHWYVPGQDSPPLWASGKKRVGAIHSETAFSSWPAIPENLRWHQPPFSKASLAISCASIGNLIHSTKDQISVLPAQGPLWRLPEVENSTCADGGQSPCLAHHCATTTLGTWLTSKCVC